MTFKFENLGTIKEAEIEIGNLTVICGKNNTGKTYLTYAIWGLMEAFPGFITVSINANNYTAVDKYEIAKKLQKGEEVTIDIRDLEDNFKDIMVNNALKDTKELSKIFSTPSKKYFQNTKINLEKESVKFNFNIPLGGKINSNLIYEKSADSYLLKLKLEDTKNINFDDVEPYLNLIFHRILTQNTFLLTTQRDNIQLFYKDIDSNRSHLIKQLRESRHFDDLDKNTSRFALPIEKNIDFARDLTTQIIKTDSFLREEQPELLEEIEKMLGINFVVSNDAVFVKDSKTNEVIPDFMASTSVRSLMYLHFWLKHRARKGDILMIDEPELSLHPENQVKMARIFAKLVNVGIKVWITTHSDYIVKELNNCLMLSQKIENKEELMKELGYQENEILRTEDVRAYIAYHLPEGGAGVQRIDMDKYGMLKSTFDDAIDKINETANKLAQNID